MNEINSQEQNTSQFFLNLLSTPLYDTFIQSKNNYTIPVCVDGKTIESKYDPLKDSLRFLETIPKSDFYLIFGIGSGIFINELKNKYPDSFIFAIEKNNITLDFLRKLPLLSSLEKNKNVKFCSISDFESTFSNYYLPSIYGNLQIVEQKGWISANQELYAYLKKLVFHNIDIISNDFATQAHFGKIWQKNILNNIKIYSDISQTDNFSSETNYFEFDKSNLQKKAAIIAAGPSLDKTSDELIQKRNTYFIISTDTAFSSLLKKNIIPDAVISIDGQNISHSHFFINKHNLDNTIFIFDLCADSSSVKYLSKMTDKILFSVSGHPLSEFIYSYSKKSFIHLYSGAGTVTIAAFDFAKQCGFSEIEVFGADFSYIDGKSYTKGTYLENISQINNSKINSSEKYFSQLQFRTQLQKIDKNKFSTKILSFYKDSFTNYLFKNNFSFIFENDKYLITNKKLQNNITKIKPFTNFLQLNNDIQTSIKNKTFDQNINSIFDLNPLDISLLPLISWLRIHDNNSNDFKFYLKKAYMNFIKNRIF